MINLKSLEGFLITFRQADLGKLQADAYSVILQHYAKGHINIKADLRICFWRKKYLMISQIPVYGTEKSTNKIVKIYSGAGDIRKFIIAKWKFDHMQHRGSDFLWNRMTFECDGSSINISTDYSDQILKDAIQDVNNGVVDQAVKSFFGAIRSVVLGKYRQSGSDSR